MDRATFNIDVALSSIINPKVQSIELEDDAQGISANLGNGSPGFSNLRTTSARLRGGRPVDQTALDRVARWLQALHGLEILDPRYKVNSKIDLGLKLITEPLNKYPFPFPEVAQTILQELDDANWGEEIVETENAGSEINATAESTPARARRESSLQVVETADDDPIFGPGKIMHDIQIFRGKGNGKSYRINMAYQKPPSKVFGHNGIEVGRCWPFQIAAFRDGAHGRTMGGIAGTATEGCYSIVVSGKYDDIDYDLGHTIYYSDSKALSNKSERPEQTGGSNALRRSITTRKPVRVLRSSGGKWAGCPKVGLRYDGLYRVIEEKTLRNKLGGGYAQFTLKRIVDPNDPQPEIQTNEPNVALAKQIKRAKDGKTIGR